MYKRIQNKLIENLELRTLLSAAISDPTDALLSSNGLGASSLSAQSIQSSVSPQTSAALTGISPTVATASAASPSTVTGNTSLLSVLGADDNGEANLTYTWSAISYPSSGFVTFSANGNNASKNSTATFSLAGAYTLQATITDAEGLTVTSNVNVTINGLFTTSTKIGTFTPSPASSVSGGVYTVTGAGSLANSSATDNFYYYSLPVSGNADLIVHLNSFSSTNTSAMGGIMIRSGTANNDLFAGIFGVGTTSTTSRTSSSFARTTAAASSSAATNTTGIILPWLKISRNGSTFTTFYSADGTNWTQSASYTIAGMPTSALFGLVSSRSTSTTANNVVGFNNVSLIVRSPSNAPTIASPAAATPTTVTTNSTNLSVLGADDNGDANLSYLWSVSSKPSGAADPTFSINGTNSAKNTAATFSRSGAYTFLATITDISGNTVTSSVNVTVNQTLTSISVSPLTTSVVLNAQKQFTASANDQFGLAMVVQPSFTWSVSSGNGSISSSGLYTAPSTTGSATITATSGALVGNASVSVTNLEVGHWKFDEGTGTTAVDSSGAGHNATLGSGVTWVAGNVGSNAIHVAGTSTGVATITGPVVDTSGDFTVSAWVNLSSLSGFQTIASIAGTSVAGFFLQLRGDTGKFGFARLPSDAGGTAAVAAAQSAPVIGRWYHIVGVNNATAGTLSLYVDGQLQNTTTYTSSWKANGNTYIGQGFYGGALTDFTNGSIDDVAFYGSALTSNQIIGLDKSAAYTFDEGTGSIGNDISNHGINLNLGSGASWTTGRAGTQALDFNGTSTGNATATLPAIDTAQSFSVSAWVKMDAATGSQTFVSIDGANVSGFYLQLLSNGKFGFTRIGIDSVLGQAYTAESTASAESGKWYHLLGINDVTNGQIKLYVNGLLQSIVTAPAGWTAAGQTVVGGGKFGGNRTDFVNGVVEDVQFFNTALATQAATYTLFPLTYNTQSVINIPTLETGPTIPSDFFGIFMEDINYSGEGGMYNDLVKNSGFSDTSNYLNAWSAVTGSGVTASLTSDVTTGPTAALPRSGMLSITSGVSSTSRVGISNSGFFGVAVKPSTTYSVEFYAKATSGFTGPLTVSLESNSGVVQTSAVVATLSTTWTKYTVTMTTSAGVSVSATNKFVISTNQASANGATIWLGSVHCFPPSYQNAKAHLRVDLMDKLAAMHPGTYRVPGGNYLEGNDYANRFNWSQTIGRLEDRPGHMNPWGYWSSDGMGLDEYLQMAELVGARPLLGVFAGYTLNGTSSTGAQLTADVQDALNELHYVLDPITTSWGAMRAANGHPAPYDVREVEIGNEDWFSSTYPTRYPLFYNAIRTEFPSLKIIASATSTGGSPYDIIDDHYYLSPATMQNDQDLYDSRARGSNKVFVGEWAAQEGRPTNTLSAALGDATFLMGLQENSDLVTLEAYAPLFANVNGVQWSTNLIGFDNTSSYGSPSYYAQVMLGNIHGSTVISNSKAGSSSGLRTMVTRSGDKYYLAVVNVSASINSTTINLSGVGSFWPTATVTTLAGSSAAAVNSIANPTLISPSTLTIGGVDNGFSYSFPANSLTIIQFTANNSAVGNVPTVAVPASATPVTGATTSLSVLGADNGGESSLTYTWNTIGTPPAPVNFSINGTNAAKNTIATFTASGTYQFQVTITNAEGKSVLSQVTVVVQPVVSGFSVSPNITTVEVGLIVPLNGSYIDQFGLPMSTPQQDINWTLTSGTGTLRNTGVYYAPASPSTAIITATIPGYSPVSVTINVVNSLQAFYAANETSGTSLTDSSGHNLNGTLSGSYSFGSGVNGNALNLTGGLATLPTGIVSGLNSDFSIATWVKPTSLQNWARIFDFGTSTSNYMFLTTQNGGNGRPRFAINVGGNGEQILQTDSAVLNLNTWSHIAVSIIDTKATLYINGVVVGTSIIAAHPADMGVTTQNYLGDSQFASDPMYQGSIDDFRIYSHGLSQSEIQTLINSQPAYLANDHLYIDFGASPISVSASGSLISVSTAGTILTFDSNTFSDILVSGTAAGNLLTLNTTLPKPMSFFGGTGNDSFTIASGASFTFPYNVNKKTSSLALTINGSAGFESSQTLSSLTVNGQLNVSAGRDKLVQVNQLAVPGKLDLNDNSMIINYAGQSSPYGSIKSMLQSGLTLIGGSGLTGIGSSMVDNQTLPGTMLAIVDDGDPLINGGITTLSGFNIPSPTTSILIKFTWFGDVDFSGSVDGSDYALVDTGFTSDGNLHDWVFGDLDYNGVTDDSDYALIDTGFVAQNSVL